MASSVKKYKAVIKPKDGIPSDDYDSTLLLMELTFTVGPQSLKTPQSIVRSALMSFRLYNFMEVISLEEVLRDGLHPDSEPD
jgi:hypothetical protein